MHAGNNLCGDETSLETSSYCEGKTGIIGQILNNTTIMKGSQIVLIRDVHHIKSHTYMHRHKFYVNYPGCNLWGKIRWRKSWRWWSWWRKDRMGMREKHSVNTHTQHGKITSVGIRRLNWIQSDDQVNPTHSKYTGDANVRPVTQHNQDTRDKIKDVARGKRSRPWSGEVKWYNFAKLFK